MVRARAYALPVSVRQTGATAAASVVWAARNTSTRVVYVPRVVVVAQFDGTAAASTSRYELRRFRTATPTGGAALTVASLRGGAVTPGIGDARVLDTGLTLGAATKDEPLATVGAARQVASSAPLIFRPESGPLELLPDDGLWIELGVTAVIGDSLTGCVEFYELS